MLIQWIVKYCFAECYHVYLTLVRVLICVIPIQTQVMPLWHSVFGSNSPHMLVVLWPGLQTIETFMKLSNIVWQLCSMWRCWLCALSVYKTEHSCMHLGSGNVSWSLVSSHKTQMLCSKTTILLFWATFPKFSRDEVAGFFTVMWDRKCYLFFTNMMQKSLFQSSLLSLRIFWVYIVLRMV